MQNIQGILPSEFQSNMEANSLVFAHAVADTIGNGFSYEGVEITELDLNIKTLRRKLDAGSTDVTYTVTYNARSMNFDTYTEGQESMTSWLATGVEDGTFTENMQAWNTELALSDVNGDLGSATSDSVETTYEGSTTTYDDDDDGIKWANRASANVIAGVLIGIGVVVLIGVVFYVAKSMSS